MREFFYWRVEEGKLKAVRWGSLTHELPFPIDLERYSNEDVSRFAMMALEMASDFAVSSEKREAVATPPQIKAKQATRMTAAQKRELIKKDGRRGPNASKGFRYTNETGFLVPDDMRHLLLSKYLAKAPIEFAYQVGMKLGTFTKNDVIKASGWTWPKHHLDRALIFWRSRGLVDAPTVRMYRMVPIDNAVRELAKKRGAVDPVMVHNALWVPRDVARAALERLSTKDVVEKHARKEEYGFKVESLKQAKLEAEVSGPSVQLYEAPQYDPKDFHFVKGVSTLCDSCRHHYRHAYWHSTKRVKYCGGCYEKIGGRTTHGKNATIQKKG